MCAIAGAFNLAGDPVPVPVVQRMLDVMDYRGPDGQGVFLDRALAIGHRRLSIIDLSPAGHQPMTNQDRSLWLVFNGEIYNYLELVPILQKKGYSFKSRSDSEVLLYSYEEWGEECVHRFNGMWAFAIWDSKKRRLFLSRDRFGVKPLYYCTAGRTFYFASEIKALLTAVPQKKTPNYPYLYHFMGSGALDDGDETFFDGIHQLLPAHSLVIDSESQHLKNYWQYDGAAARSQYDYSCPETTFRHLLADAVKLRLRSDVPVGTCLSGGLDSSSIVALATGMMDHPIKTFSCLYQDQDCNEATYVEVMNRYCKTDPYPVTPSGDDLFDVLPRIVWHQDEPTAGPGLYSQWHVMKEAHGRVKVLLDGQGGDELLGGYFSYFPIHLADLLKRFLATHHVGDLLAFIRAIRQVSRLTSPQVVRTFLMNALPTQAAAMLHRAGRLARTLGGRATGTAPPILHHEFVESVKDREIRREYPDRFEDDLNNVLYWHLTRQSIPALLHYEDRNSMAFSIEARTPFLDYRLVEFCLGLSPDLKIREGTTKLILRNALQHDLPREIVERKDKKGYPTPMARWFREGLREKTREVLCSAELAQRHIFDPAGVRHRFEKHCRGEIDASWEIYRWLTTELWFRTFID
jgi:asparagine synthase (glutamine-hydrolysing)